MNARTGIALFVVGLVAPACGDDASIGEADSSTSAEGSSSGAPATSTGVDPTGDTTAAAETTSTSEASSDATTDAGSSSDTTDTGASESEGSSSDTTAADPICGDGIVDDGEVCDTDTLGGESCESQGFLGGALGCLPDCTAHDTSECVTPGDCCDAHETIGCADAVCEADICGADPFCCDDHWDGVCTDAALASEACLDVGGACPCPDEAIDDALGPGVAGGDTTDDDDDFGTSCGGSDGNDRVIYFIAPDAATYRFDTFGSSYDTKLSIRTDCATEAACNDDAGGGTQSEVVLDLVAGQRIRIVIDGYNGAVGEWVLNVSAAPDLPAVCGDDLVDAPEICDGNNLNGQSCVFQGFGGGGVLACAADCATFDTTGCIEGPYPCSDESVGVTGAAVTSGNTSNGNDDDLGMSCGGGDGNDRVVTFTAPAVGMYTFDTFGSAYDTKLALFADCTSELYCNDDTNGLQSQLSLNMGAGQDVLVVIDGFDGASGAWVLNITPP